MRESILYFAINRTLSVHNDLWNAHINKSFMKFNFFLGSGITKLSCRLCHFVSKHRLLLMVLPMFSLTLGARLTFFSCYFLNSWSMLVLSVLPNAFYVKIIIKRHDQLLSDATNTLLVTSTVRGVGFNTKSILRVL